MLPLFFKWIVIYTHPKRKKNIGEEKEIFLIPPVANLKLLNVNSDQFMASKICIVMYYEFSNHKLARIYILKLKFG